MKRNILTFIAIAVLINVFTLSLVEANSHTRRDPVSTPATRDAASTPATCDDPSTCAQKPGTASGFDLTIKLKNPLQVETIQEAVRVFMSALVKIAVPFIIVFFIWSGFNFILAQGNPEKIKKAKNMFFNTVIGALLILGAWAITNAIVGTVNSLVN